MDADSEQEPGKQLKTWETPTLRKLGKLTQYELARLRTAKDPIALLFEIKPELKSGN